MDAAVLGGVLGAVAGALVTGLLTYFVTVWKVRRDLQVEYDQSLRDDRIKAYAGLWARTRPLSRYSPEVVDKDRCQELLDEFSDWYYEEGGIYLSEAARDYYFTFMDVLKKLSELDAEVTAAHRRTLFASASSLRTRITDDVGTRDAPLYRAAPG
jgi:hypothetical protein